MITITKSKKGIAVFYHEAQVNTAIQPLPTNNNILNPVLHVLQMKAIQGAVRTSFLAFFASHIVASLVIDAQAILPSWLVPSSLQALLSWYAKTLNDPLMSRPQEIFWFRSLICCELLFQVPFFFMACYYLTRKNLVVYPESFQYACIAYSSHTATTMVPILVTLATYEDSTAAEKTLILAAYLPYLFFPLGLLYFATRTRSTFNTTEHDKQR
jgi:hypothetical protein